MLEMEWTSCCGEVAVGSVTGVGKATVEFLAAEADCMGEVGRACCNVGVVLEATSGMLEVIGESEICCLGLGEDQSN